MFKVSLWLLSRQPQVEVVDEGRELVANQDPVLVDQVVGGDVGVGPPESLLQRVPLEGGHHMVLLGGAQNNIRMNASEALILSSDIKL